MKHTALLLLIVLPLVGQDAVVDHNNSKTAVAIPRESQLELEILAQRERDINERMDGLYKLLIAPLQLAKSEAVKHACELVGIKPFGADGKPACEVRDGKVVKLAPAAAAPKTKENEKP